MRRGKSSKGVARSNPCAYAASSSVCFKFAEVDPGPSPPSKSGRDQSATTFAGSKSYFDPSPLHAGQAPYGELKLNERGSSCGTEMPHSLHASFSENTCSVPSTTDTLTKPCASLSAVARDCASRPAMPGLTSRRSTTTSIVWFLRRSSGGGSSSGHSLPSMRARVNPARASFSSSCRYSPLRPRTTGARIIRRSPGRASSPLKTDCTICSADCRVMARPQFGQCGVPIELNTTRR